MMCTMSTTNMQDTINTLLLSGKGILAADESTPSANKRLAALRIPATEEMRRKYRQMLITTPGVADYIAGVILYEETFYQKLDNGQTFVQYLEQFGVLPGIKVDSGLTELIPFSPETVTEGLDGLPDKLAEYAARGARFTKWRSAFQVSPDSNLPSSPALHTNLEVMARYAAIVQAANMVPIVEPEVLYDGNYDISTCKETLSQVLRVLFDMLEVYKVDISHVILKTSMVMAGKQWPHQSTDIEVVEATTNVFAQRLPKELGGVVFLSGGQTPDQATNNLGAICKSSHLSWPITFSFSRAVQEPAMAAWAGQEQNIAKAQQVFAKRLADNVAACQKN